MATKEVAMSEKDFQKQIIELAKTFGWKVYHPWLSINSARGWPDLSMARERLVFVELKSTTGKVSDSQRDWIDAINAAGGEAYAWWPKDWDEAVRVLGMRKD